MPEDIKQEKKNASDLNPEQVKDLTQKRNERCEPVVRQILQIMLDNDLLLADRFYIHQMVQQSLDMIFRSIITQHANDIFEAIEKSLMRSVKDSYKILWENKDFDELSLKDVDTVLKSPFNKKNPEPKVTKESVYEDGELKEETIIEK